MPKGSVLQSPFSCMIWTFWYHPSFERRLTLMPNLFIKKLIETVVNFHFFYKQFIFRACLITEIKMAKPLHLSICTSVYLPICLSVCLSENLCISLFVRLASVLSVRLFVFLSVCPSACLCPFANMFITPFVCLLVNLSDHLPIFVHLLIRLSHHLSVCRFIRLSLHPSVLLSVHLSVCLSVCRSFVSLFVCMRIRS
jgi:hypothetical protein